MPLRAMFSRDDEKLVAILARLCQERGDLWTTQAVKLPYLVDLVAMHVLGHRLTRSHHKTWTYGVVTARAWGLIKKQEGGRYFEVYGDPYAEGARLRLLDHSVVERLTDEETAIVDFVAQEFGDMTPADLGQLTKDLNPEVDQWGGRQAIELSEDAYRRLPAWYGEDEADALAIAAAAEQIEQGTAKILTDEEALDLFAVPAR